jgi:hypothetical protein
MAQPAQNTAGSESRVRISSLSPRTAPSSGWPFSFKMFEKMGGVEDCDSAECIFSRQRTPRQGFHWLVIYLACEMQSYSSEA